MPAHPGNCVQGRSRRLTARRSCFPAGKNTNQYNSIQIQYNKIHRMESYGVLWSLMESYEVLWSLMESYGVLWRLMESYEVLWSLMKSYGVLWSFMESYGVLWSLMESY